MPAADKILLDLSPAALARAVEANINAQLRLIYARMPGVEVIDEPELLGMMAGWPDTLVNSVYWAVFAPQDAESRVDAVLDRFRERGRLPMSWIVSPETRPQDLGRYLEARGFARVSLGLGMAADLDAVVASQPAPAGLIIERVTGVEGLERWLHPVEVSFQLQDATASAWFELYASQGFGPGVPWQLFVGQAGGQVVSASRLFCAAGAAGIYHVATLPEAQGRGFGTAMVLVAACAGRELLYRAPILTASGKGYRLYRRLGFEDCCHADI